MIDWISNILYDHISYLPIFSFSLLILAGFNVPISEDIVVIISGVIASAYPQEVNPVYLYAAIFAGAYLGDFVSFFLGYFLGYKIFQIKFISKLVNEELQEKLSKYIEKHGVLTLLIGRFIPFGVRNTLFLTCGLSKMKIIRFAITDGSACLLSTSISFTLSYFFGNIVLEWIKKFQISLLAITMVLIGSFLIWRWIKKKTKI